MKIAKPSRDHHRHPHKILFFYLHPENLPVFTRHYYILESISRGKLPSEVVRALVVLLVGLQAHPVHQTGYATADERAYPVNP